MIGYERKRDARDFIDMGSHTVQMVSGLTAEQLRRYKRTRENWNSSQ